MDKQQRTVNSEQLKRERIASAPFFSIIVPVYNVAPYLHECLDSVQAQTFADWECLCVDDGSTDESGAILDEYAKKDVRFRVFHKKNSGVSAARNLALDNVFGIFCLFLDSDDCYISNRVLDKLLIELSRVHKDDLLCFGLCRVGDKSGWISRSNDIGGEGAQLAILAKENDFFPQIMQTIGFCQAVYRVNKIHQMRFDNLSLGEDVLFFYKYLLQIKNIYFFNASYYAYRERDDSATHMKMNSRSLLSSLEFRIRLLALYKASPQRIPKAWISRLKRWVHLSYLKLLFSKWELFTENEFIELITTWIFALRKVNRLYVFLQFFPIKTIVRVYLKLVRMVRK